MCRDVEVSGTLRSEDLTWIRVEVQKYLVASYMVMADIKNFDINGTDLRSPSENEVHILIHSVKQNQ